MTTLHLGIALKSPREAFSAVAANPPSALRVFSGTALAISAVYFALLIFGLLSSAFVAHWMAETYGADASFSQSLALMTLVAVPLAVGSVVSVREHDARIDATARIPLEDE